VKVVLDTSVYVAGILNPRGGSGEILRLWRDEAMFEVVASPNLFAELLMTLHKPKLQGRFEPKDPEAAIQSFRQTAELWTDVPNPPSATRDANDDFLVSLSIRSHSEALVTLDNDLLVLGGLEADGVRIPVVRPGDLLSWLRDSGLQ
jgi:putative PIN family toxin of toxin-antitoxin system